MERLQDDVCGVYGWGVSLKLTLVTFGKYHNKHNACVAITGTCGGMDMGFFWCIKKVIRIGIQLFPVDVSDRAGRG